MAKAMFQFPSGTLWGTATSSYQVEGQNTTNNWAIWEEDEYIQDGQKSGLACDWWSGRWREDFDRIAETGQNSHRLSIAWSRIQPDLDRWDEDALDHYRQMIKGLIDRGLTPMVTLHHFTHPAWLDDLGGWENEAVAGYFQAFVQKVVEALHEYVSLWCTLNEPNIFSILSYLQGVFPPGKTSIGSLFTVVKNLVRAHTLAYETIHEIHPAALVGIAHHYRGFSPEKPWSPLDNWVTTSISRNFNEIFPNVFHTGVLRFFGIRKSFPQAKGTQDFFGLNYYTRESVAFSAAKPGNFFSITTLDPRAELSPNGFIANEPETLFQGLQWANSFGLPIFITENGVEDEDDTFRPKYLIQHIHQMWRAVNFNWPIRGYYHWTLVDNFEWERGWSQRFGLWELDRETQARRKRPSADLYKAICNSNGLSSAMVSEFAPALLPIIFPG